MANEFIARNGIRALQNSQITGSLNVSGGVTASGFSGSFFYGDGSGLTNLTGVGSGVEIRDDGSILGSAQALDFTGGIGATFASSTASIFADGLFSASSQVDYAGLSNVPSGIVSASSFSSPSQGTVRAIINGLQTDVDTGLQTNDSPQFTNLTLSGNLTVNGTTTYISSSQVDIGDQIITLNANNAVGDGGIYVNDTSTNETGSLLWDVSENYWIAGILGSESEVMTLTSINAKGVVSSSTQFNSLTAPFTGSFTGSFTGDGSNLSGIPTDLQSVTDNGATTSTLTTFNGGIVVHGAQYTSGSQTGISSGTFTLSTIPTGSYRSAQWDYYLEDGTNYRAGTVIGIWNTSGNTQYTDYSTTDIGDTSGESFTVDTLNSDARLQVTVGAGTWNVKTTVRAL